MGSGDADRQRQGQAGASFARFCEILGGRKAQKSSGREAFRLLCIKPIGAEIAI